MSSSDLDPGGGGGGDGSLSFIEVNRFSFDVRWLALGSAVISGVVLAWFQAVIGFFQGIALAVETVLGSVQTRLVSVIEAVFSATGIVDAAWASAAAEVAGAGIFAFALSIAVFLSAAYLYAVGVTWLVE